MIPTPNLNIPQAARWQRLTSGADYVLTDYARVGHPTVAWWWGGRLVDGTFGAWCYLCESHIATWARAWPITVAATAAVLGHRSAHLDGSIPTPGVNASSTQLAAVATVQQGEQK